MTTEQQQTSTESDSIAVLKTNSSKHALALLTGTGLVVAGAGFVAWWILQR